jgi:hypothetical protein
MFMFRLLYYSNRKFKWFHLLVHTREGSFSPQGGSERSKRRTDLEKEIVSSIQQGQFAKIAADTEEWEYACAEGSKEQPLYGVQLLAYLIQNELHYARFLWKRIPKKVKESDPELAAIWAIAQNMWNKKYAEFYQSLQGYNWAPGTVQLIQALAERFRERTFQLVSAAYSNITISDLSALLGVSEEDALGFARKANWEIDTTTRSVNPRPLPRPKIQGTGLEQLQQLTEYVVYLEQK